MRIYKENAGAQCEARTQTHTLREPAQSKCTWTFHKCHFVREFKGKMPGRRGPNPRGTFRASLRNRIAFQHFTKATLHRNLQVKGRRPRASKTRAANFVRACAIEMHLEISQEPLYAKISRKNVGVQMEHPDQAPAFTLTVRTPQCGRTVWGTYHKNPSVWTHCLGAVETHVKISQDSRSARQDFTRAILHGNSPIKCRRPNSRRRLCASLRSRNAHQDFTGKIPQTKTTPQTLCKPAQSERMSRFHKSHFIQKFTGKMPQPRVSTLIKHRPLHLP